MTRLQLSAIVLFIAAALLGYGSLSAGWVTSRSDESSAQVGLRGFTYCTSDDECKAMSFDELGGTDLSEKDVVMVWAGKFSFGLGLAGALAALVCAVMFLTQAKRTGAIVVLGLGIASLIGAVTFLITITTGSPDLSRGLASYTYLAGASGLIIAGVIALGKQTAAAPLLMTTASAPTTGDGRMVPACAQCAAPTAWVHEYQRFFCSRCRLYV